MNVDSARQRPLTRGGTGSMPGRANGWHRATRRSASHVPRRRPCSSSAPIAYAEHDGSNRHAPPMKWSKGELIRADDENANRVTGQFTKPSPFEDARSRSQVPFQLRRTAQSRTRAGQSRRDRAPAVRLSRVRSDRAAGRSRECDAWRGYGPPRLPFVATRQCRDGRGPARSAARAALAFALATRRPCC